MPPCLWTLGVFGHLFVGFVKPFTLVVGLVYLFGGFYFILRAKFLNVNNHMFKCEI